MESVWKRERVEVCVNQANSRFPINADRRPTLVKAGFPTRKPSDAPNLQAISDQNRRRSLLRTDYGLDGGHAIAGRYLIACVETTGPAAGWQGAGPVGNSWLGRAW
jgi:hypothetical protein